MIESESYMTCPHSDNCRIYNDWARQGNEQVDVIKRKVIEDVQMDITCLALEGLRNDELDREFRKRFKEKVPNCGYLYQLECIAH
jgi:hypothetical protein